MTSSSAVRRAVRNALLVSAMSASAISALPANAQDSTTLDKVVVTGSRIQRANLTEPTAVTTVDSEVIEESGLINVADILRTVPSFGVSALSSSNSNFLTSSSGINTLQLRNLGEDRTLVLVNGRRHVSGVPGSAAVDFNTIPVELVERVEIITGGASAVYGSDALAGVINVILKKNFDGLTVNYQHGEATEGGDIENRGSVTMGSNFADGRGNAVVSISFSQQKGLLSRERDNTRVDDLSQCLLTGITADCQISVEPFYSSFSEYGRFFVPSTGASFVVSSGVGPTGTVAPWSSATYGFNRQQFRRYTVPTDRYMVASEFNYEVGAGVNAFVETTIAQTRTKSELEPFPHSNSDLSIAGIDVNNPFVPAAIAAAVTAAGDTEIEYFRRMTEVGQRGAQSTRNTYRFVVGFNGDVADLDWETFYSFGRMDDSQQGGGQINVPNMRNALNAIVDGSGNIVCADPAAVAEGCVPINIFGRGAISQAAADYVRAPTSRQMLAQQEVFGADLSGALFDMPAGPFSFAAGVEWRRERAEDVPDVLTQAGLNAGNAEAPVIGDYNVREGFIELDVPLLKDLPGVHDLSIGGAYRYSDYSTVDTTSAYTGRISWAPVESLRIRGQYARAVRAPNVGELFSPGGENFAPVSDPCNGVTATSVGIIDDNCRAIPEIAARIAATGSFTLTQTEIQGTGGFTSKGNPNLDPETSDSWSLGVVFDHNFGTAGSMTLSVDYFKIEIEQLIDTIGRQSTVDFCFDSTTFPNQFCPFLTRDTTGAAFQLGELTEVNSGYVNEGTLETEGIDVSFLWQWRMSDWIEAVPGAFALRMNYTYLMDFTETKFGVSDELVGETGYSESKGQMALAYEVGPWRASWEWTYVGDAVPDKSSSLFNFSVGSYSTHDLQLGFDFGESDATRDTFLGSLRVYAGVNNVFEEDAPIILSGVPGNTTGTDTDASVYDPIGRTWYAGLSLTF